MLWINVKRSVAAIGATAIVGFAASASTAAALNPQPLPPLEHHTTVFLNPQPLPPIVF